MNFIEDCNRIPKFNWLFGTGFVFVLIWPVDFIAAFAVRDYLRLELTFAKWCLIVGIARVVIGVLLGTLAFAHLNSVPWRQSGRDVCGWLACLGLRGHRSLIVVIRFRFKKLQELGVQTLAVCGNDVDDDQSASAPEVVRAFGDKGLARLCSILVTWADEFNYGG